MVLAREAKGKSHRAQSTRRQSIECKVGGGSRREHDRNFAERNSKTQTPTRPVRSFETQWDKAATLSGLSQTSAPFPRVARSSQPWAGGHNPFGIAARPRTGALRRLGPITEPENLMK